MVRVKRGTASHKRRKNTLSKQKDIAGAANQNI